MVGQLGDLLEPLERNDGVLMKNLRVIAAAFGVLLLLGGYLPSTVAPIATAAPKLEDLKGVEPQWGYVYEKPLPPDEFP